MIIQYHEYEILVWFDLRLVFFLSPHTTSSYTFQTWIYREKKCDVWNWNCCTPSISVGLVLRCAFFWWWISHFTTSWEIFQVSDVYLTVCLKLHTSQGCFCPQTFFRDTKLNMLSWNSLASGLHYQLALSAGVFHALWLIAWWRHQMEIFSALLAICAGNSPVTGEFPTQRPVTRSFDVYFDLRPKERLSKQWWGWWFETLSRSLWRHRNGPCGVWCHGLITWPCIWQIYSEFVC